MSMRPRSIPRVHQVLLVDAFNAAVCQLPRLGVLGWQKNHLLIGLPFLQAFSREQYAHAPVAEARVLLGDGAHPLHHRRVLHIEPALELQRV